MVEQADHAAGAAAAFGSELLDSRPSHRDQGELGGDEEPVGENEQDDREQRDRGTNGVLQTGSEPTARY
jgi:hypothetical protein